MAQDLKGKKTRLDDGADIYQQRREVSERQKWKELDGAGKLAYFRDYYLMKLIGALAAVLLLYPDIRMPNGRNGLLSVRMARKT